MGLKIDAFERELRLAQGFLSPDALRIKLANYARAELGAAIGSGRASPRYQRFVNGQEGVSEFAVKLPGPILYIFAPPLGDAVEFAVAFLKARYPVVGPARGGHYRDSFVLLVNGQRAPLTRPIPAGAEAILVNTQPYARKVHVGSKGFRLSKGLFENARQAMLERWRGLLDIQIRFIELSGGYVLKGARPDVAARQNRRSSAFRAGRATLAKRKDTDAGQPLKYPALVISART